MDTTTKASLRNVERAREELHSYLKLKDPAFAVIEELLKKYRIICVDFIFLDFQAAVLEETEQRLWDSHGRVNKLFRGHLARFRDGKDKKKHVERRKMEKHFLDFIKSSMRFYRGFIQRLASHFEGVPKILEIARKFSLDTLSVDPPVQAPGTLRQPLIESCYLTLIHLGDLSRYRETELVSKDRNWGPAKGYYDLATALQPGSGTSYNALAVLALQDEDHFRALYYFNRAVAVPEPPQIAYDNLELEFKKISERVAKEKPLTPLQDGSALSMLHAEFAIFHAKCHQGHDFEGYNDAEAGMLNHLSVHIKEGPADGVLGKFCLVNIAAEARAKAQLADDYNEQNDCRWTLLQGLSVQTFSTLLRLLIEEVERPVLKTDSAGAGDSTLEKLLTTTLRRILPSIRHCSTWLLNEAEWLLAQENEALIVRVQEFWKLYVQALNCLTLRFPNRTFPDITYLLDEDEDTVAFMPFKTEKASDRYRGASGALKPTSSDLHVHRCQPNDEMFFRIKKIVRDGINICNMESKDDLKPPITFAQGQFVYRDPESVELASTQLHQSAHVRARSSVTVTLENAETAKRTKLNGTENAYRSERDNVSVSTDTSTNMSDAMQDMVDELVESEASEHSEAEAYHELGPRTPTLNTISGFSSTCTALPAPNSINAQDLVRQMQRSPNTVLTGAPGPPHGLSMSSIWSPRPGETASRPGTSHGIGLTPSGSAPSPRSSASHFQEAIAQQQQQLQMRSSPQQSLQLSSLSVHETPMGMRSMTPAGLGIEQKPPFSSPWQSSPVRFDSSGHGDVIQDENKSPQRALFGAIGERPKGNGQRLDKTPTSGQPG